MKTDGLFTVHQHTIEWPNNKPFRLIFFGDVHRDSPNHADAHWQDFLSYARGLKDAWFIGMGDYVDSASTSERACLDRADLHETTKADLITLAQKKVDLLAKELRFMKGRLIGLVNGNHYFTFNDASNTDMRLCRELDCKYLGVSTFTRIYHAHHGRKHSLDIWAHHGGGGGRLLGGSINRVDQMREHAEADIYVQGHDHKRYCAPATPRLRLDHHARDGLKIVSRQQWLIRSGSFLKSYEPGERNYNVDAGRGPCSLGHVELLVMPRVCGHGKEWRGFDIRGLC